MVVNTALTMECACCDGEGRVLWAGSDQYEPCPGCDSTGAADVCDYCDGDGTVVAPGPRLVVDCAECLGTGQANAVRWT